MGMWMAKEELVLIGINFLLHEKEKGHTYTKSDLSQALDITPKTLNDYLKILRDVGLLETKQRKFIKDLDVLVKITDKGRERVELILRKIENLILTPENHNIPNIVMVKAILDLITDPLEKIFFLNVFSSNKDFDLFLFLDVLGISRADSNIVNIFSGPGEGTSLQQGLPFIVTFSKTSFHGGLKGTTSKLEGWSEKDPAALLIISESCQKQGRLKEAKAYYEFLLSPSTKLTQNHWFIARIGLVQTLRKSGDMEKALELLEETMGMTDNKTFIAYAKQIKAMLYSMEGKFNESMVLYNSSIRSFHFQGFPLMLSIAYNNRGTLFYRMGLLDHALDDWNKALRYAKEAGSEYCEAGILSNLADMYGRRKEFDRALNYLDRGEKITIEAGDMEMCSSIHFNFALVYIMMGDMELALEHYRKSLEVAHPLPPPIEREERKKFMLDYAREFNLPLMENNL